ncbi:MAG: hypothetical protein QM784_35275 [Polyangiaceae bacterium]
MASSRANGSNVRALPRAHWVIAFAILCPVFTWGVPAAAAERRASRAVELRLAADWFDEGRIAFKAGAFAEAAEHFEAADAHAPSASALALAMRSRTEAGQHAKASSLAEIVLIRHGDNPELVERAKATLTSHEGELSILDVVCRPECELVVDQKLVHGAAATVWRVHVDPGHHDVVASFEGGREGNTAVDVTAAQRLPLSFESEVATPEAAPSAVIAPPGSATSSDIAANGAGPSEGASKRFVLPREVFWIGVGLTGALAVATTWSGIDTVREPGQAHVKAVCADPARESECDRLYDDGQSKELRTNVLLGSTIVLAIATAATGLFATDFGASSPKSKPDASTRSPLRLRPLASLDARRGAFFGAEGRF